MFITYVYEFSYNCYTVMNDLSRQSYSSACLPSWRI